MGEMRGLSGKAAVVTGSSSGIGKAIALRLASEGVRVVINSRMLERAQSVADELRERGLDAIAVAADIAKPEEAQRLAEACLERFDRLDIWVNNAGTNAIAPSIELEADAYRAVIDVNLNGVFFGSQAAGRVMVPQRSGVIIQIGSIFGEVGMPMRAAYCSAKHGLVGLTKVLASEWAPHGVRVLAVEPAYIRTALDQQDQQTGDYSNADIERRTPMRRYGTVEEVASVVAFAASDEATYLTGISIPVDGGWVAYGGW